MFVNIHTHFEQSDGIFILGSTEPHYTPSKTYQGVLSGKPIFAMLHKKSSAASILEETSAGVVFKINPDTLINDSEKLKFSFKEFLLFQKNFSISNVNQERFEEYSARKVTETLVGFLDKAVK
jgi:hypothetical protein